MKTYVFRLLPAFFAISATLSNAPLFAGDFFIGGLGGGEPGLKIVFRETNDFVIYADEPTIVGTAYAGGMSDRKIRVVADRNYGIDGLINGRNFDIPQQLYSFDDRTAFTCEGGRWSPDFKTWRYWPRDAKAYSMNGDDLLVCPDIYGMAREKYGLATNQLFLGKIGTNVFYWETQNPRTVFFRAASGADVTKRLSLPGNVVDIYGATRGVKNEADVGFVIFGKSRGFFHYSPYDFSFIERPLKDAKSVKAGTK